jgi:hypothetical protein
VGRETLWWTERKTSLGETGCCGVGMTTLGETGCGLGMTKLGEAVCGGLSVWKVWERQAVVV